MTNAEGTSANLKTSTAHLNDIATNVQTFSSDLANSNIRQTLDNANKAVAQLQATIDKINNGKGSLSMLINDQQLYTHLDSASANLNKLFIDLKAHPKKYVSFSVFGKKQK
jgi:phospholipid/cholesterol/gamma-HCH transport system substrate-binding protein